MAVERQQWGEPLGIPEGSDFVLEAKLTVHGATDTSRVTSSGTSTLNVGDSVLNGGVELLNSAAGTVVTATGVATFTITDATSSDWEAGTYNGDIKVVDSGGLILYWPVSLKIREASD